MVILVDSVPPESNGTVIVTAVWRRHDSNPQMKNTYIVDAESHLLVPKCTRVDANGDNGTFVFNAVNGPGEYHLYYMPFTSCEFAGGGCPFGASATYEAVGENGRGCTDSRDWYAGVPPSSMAVPSAVVQQSRSAFSAFPPIEQPATATELATLLATADPSSPALLFPEGREQPIRMTARIPMAWASRNLGSTQKFTASAQPSEHFTFQVAVYAHKGAVTVASVLASDLTGSAPSEGGGALSSTIPASAIHCMNLAGLDYWARPYTPESPVEVQPGTVVPLWIAVDVPTDQAPATYSGTLTVAFASGAKMEVEVALAVAGVSLGDDHGDSQQWRGTRLRWLDSDLAASGDSVPPPFTPLTVKNVSESGSAWLDVSMLDKRIGISSTGLIGTATVGNDASAASNNYENAVVGTVFAEGRQGIELEVNGVAATGGLPHSVGAASSMEVPWHAAATAGDVPISVDGSLDATGYMDFGVTVGPVPSGMADVTMTLPANPANAFMMMGLGAPGGYIDELPPPTAPTGTLSQWLVLDFGHSVPADAFGLFTSADGVHDPAAMLLQTSASPEGPWKPAGTFNGASRVAGRQLFKFGDQMVITSRFWRLIIVDVVASTLCAPNPFCQAWIGEVQLRVAATAQWIDNSGNVTKVLASSGAAVPDQPAQKAADGDLVFAQATHEGWDAAMAAVPGVPPPPPPSNATAWRWTWDGVNGNNALWVGSSAAGFRLFLKGSDPLWQAGVPFDSRATPDISELNWYNNGAGSVEVMKNGTVVVRTGQMALPKGSTTTFNFSVMLTPVRPLNLSKHFSERYVQLGGPANYTELAEGGATVVNMHQGNAINPWINYCYRTVSLMLAAAQECHSLGMKFKLYNTMRELSNRAREIWAMRALNETYVHSTGSPEADVTDGADWLQEHVQTDYVKAWSNPVQNVYPGSNAVPYAVPQWLNDDREQDAAIKVKALSRWNNYYVEGLRQLIVDTEYDGIYLDEIAYDRVTMLRSKKVLGSGRLIDHHSDRGGFTISPAANYLELYPFIDSLWYGEGFNYEASSASYWLLEISGVPHGLNSDLLRYSGMVPAHFKGMLFGNANRWQYGGSGPDPFDPRAIWALWHSFKIDQAKLFGWWMERERGTGTVPVLTSNSSVVKATSFVRAGEATLVVLASFAPTDVAVTLKVDWQSLGLPPTTKIQAPQLTPMQTAKTFGPGDSIVVPAGQGWIFLLSK